MREITEKDRRVYYQDIVYDVCHVLDQISGVTEPVNGITCGTATTPSTRVKIAMRRVKVALLAAKAVLDDLGTKEDGVCLYGSRETWNKDAHVSVTLTVSEIWALQDALSCISLRLPAGK